LGVGDELLARNLALRFKGSALDADRTMTFLANEANHLVVAEVGSEVAGYLLAYSLDRLDRPNEQLLVYDVEVIPDRRRLGIGSALMRYVRDEVERASLMEAFVLTSRGNTAALALYSSTGGVEDKHEGGVVMFVYPGFAPPEG